MNHFTGALYEWRNSVHQDYKVLDSTEGWGRCERCDEFPMVWVYDNGNFAKCRCFHKWDGGVSASSIIDAVVNQKMSYEDYKKLLRDAWNKYLSDKK